MVDDQDILEITTQFRDQLVNQLGTLLKEKVVLQQNLREEKKQALAQSEKLFLELIEIVDALEFLLDYLTKNQNPPPEFYQRLPKSVSSILNKLLSVLSRRQVTQISSDHISPLTDNCRVVDREISSELPDNTITKIVRHGYKIEDKILRPIEIITSKLP